MPGLLRDADIREALSAEIRLHHARSADTVIRHELGLCAGQRRVDLAVINGEMSGYEIKSDVDTLARLCDQAEAYGRVFDRMSIATTDRFLEAASSILPSWWGVLRIHSTLDGAVSEVVRPAELNTGQDPFAIAQLLWREEAMEVLRTRNLEKGLSKKRRWFVWQRLAETTPLPELRSIVRDRIKARQDWPGGS